MLILRRRRPARRRATLLAAMGATTAVVAAAGVRFARGRRGSEVEDTRRSRSCACGQGYLVSGIDRHRVYWLPDAAPSDPLLGRACAACAVTLPAGHDTAMV